MERDLWHALRDAVSPHGHIERIENMVGNGMPDVTFCILPGIEGFIELKWAPRWPKDPTVILKLKHFTPQQRIWLRQRTRAGGRCYVLLQVGDDRILLTGEWAQRHLGLDATKADITANALFGSRLPLTSWIRRKLAEPII